MIWGALKCSTSNAHSYWGGRLHEDKTSEALNSAAQSSFSSPSWQPPLAHSAVVSPRKLPWAVPGLWKASALPLPRCHISKGFQEISKRAAGAEEQRQPAARAAKTELTVSSWPEAETGGLGQKRSSCLGAVSSYLEPVHLSTANVVVHCASKDVHSI